MLRRTFIHIPGVGPQTERALWDDGFVTWDDLLSSRRPAPPVRALRPAIRESARRLALGDASYFHRALPSAERWRLYPSFLSDAAFLDIETTGLTPGDSVTTLVGILDRNGYTPFIRGQNLDELAGALRRYRLIVTFNGARFDLPFLEAEFGGEGGPPLFHSHAHLDLMHTLRLLGLRGGLKAIERTLGVGRPSRLANLGGFDAVRLWALADEGEPGALETLIRYNAEDVASLPRLAAIAMAELAAGTPLADAPCPAFPAFDASTLPFDRSIVEHLPQRKAYRISRRRPGLRPVLNLRRS